MSPGETVVVKKEETGYSVQYGILSEEHLDAGEALWCVVNLLTGSGRGFLRTPIEHAIWDMRYNCPRNLLAAGAAE